MEDAELGARLFADRAGQPQRELGAWTAADGNEHAADRRGVRPYQRYVTGRVDQEILDGVDPEAVLPRLAAAGFEQQQVCVRFEDRLPDALRGDVRDPNLAS